jgi:CHAT domain-containing protein
VRGEDNEVPTALVRFAGFAPHDDQIPQAQAEIDLAARYFAEAKLFHNETATVANLWQAAGDSDVLHLATHGLFRPDNSFFSAIKLADGWVDVREIYRLRVAAQLVVLSACESGVGDVRGGDEIVGLARGFLAAGAEHLIASLWNVHDSSAARFMDNLYEHLQRGSVRPRDYQCSHGPAAALRAAQTQALHAGEHPYFWAPFFAIG